MYFQLGSVQTYTDFRVLRTNYGILATNVNATVWRCYQVYVVTRVCSYRVYAVTRFTQ